jgi:hypothetical protein
MPVHACSHEVGTRPSPWAMGANDIGNHGRKLV